MNRTALVPILILSLSPLPGCAGTDGDAQRPRSAPAAGVPARTPAAAAPSAPAAAAPAGGWAPYFAGRPGCFVLFRARTETWVQSDEDACRRRMRPFSTFKIPHAIIALQEGVLADADTVIPWDRARYPAEPWWPEAWRHDNDLRSAIQRSVVPYFRTVARRLGTATLAAYLARWQYGNQSVAGEPDAFWLTGELAISPP
jgi:beta-lactamase class D